MFFPEMSPRFAHIVYGISRKPIAVLGHMRPDGDCIGSQVALARVLRSMGIDAVCANHHPPTRILKSFVGDTPFFEAEHFEDSTRIAFVCDAADRPRLGEPLNALFPNIHLCVDHHITNTGYATHNLIEPTAAATAEILAGIFFDLDYPMDPVTAQALYVGIATDTGQFQYGSTTRRVFELAGRLLECGANPGAASVELYEQESEAKIRLLQRFLASLKREMGQRACIGCLRQKDFSETGATYEDTESLVDYARCLEGVDIGILLEERGAFLKGSLRAKEPSMRVDQLALSLGGGGHPCAAGFSIPGQTIDGFYAALLERLAAHFDNPVNALP